jgi:hypothetical protein
MIRRKLRGPLFGIVCPRANRIRYYPYPNRYTRFASIQGALNIGDIHQWR